MTKKLLFLFFLIYNLSLSAQEDCISAITICGNSNINYTPSGIGNINENLGGCLSGEHHSVWYKFTIATSGTLTFDLVPTGPADYDWAIYGPDATCSNLGPPIRCNASGALTSTGMNTTNTNTSSSGGNTNPYCKYMDVTAGQTYYLYLDNWSSTVHTFNLTWGGTASFISPFNNPATTPNPFIPPGNPGPNPNSPREIDICSTTTLFNFSTLSTGILNGNSNFNIAYFSNTNDASTGNNPITAPIIVNTNTTYYYSIDYHDPNNQGNTLNTCRQIHPIVFRNKSLIAEITPSANKLCPGGTITLTSSHATGNTWSTGETTQSITVNTPGTYSLISSNGICTSPPASITISAESDPDIQISGNLIVCEAPTQLTASSTGNGNTYAWSDGSAGNTISVSTPGTYTVTVTTPAGCQYQKSVTVTQTSAPNVQDATLSQCSNSSTATFDLTSAQSGITSSPGVTFEYYTNLVDAAIGNTNTIANPSAYVSGNTTVYVRITSAACSRVYVVKLQLYIQITNTPFITASSDTICFGGSITLTSNQTTGNTWSTGETTQSITVNTPGTYTLTSSVAGCQSIPASITISAESDPDIQISGNLIVCEALTQLTASSTGNGNTYTWSDGSAGNIISVSAPGTYTVTVTTPAGCQYQKSVTVTQGPVPIVQNAALSQCANSSTATFDLTSAQPGITSTPGVTFAYYTNQADAMAGNANTITNPSVYVSANAVVYVRVASAACFKVAEIQLSILTTAVPSITASSDTICFGGNITLTSNQTTGNTWSTGETTQSITVNTPGTYTLTSSVAGCQSIPASITISAESDPDIQISGNLIVCEAPTQLTASSTGNGNTYAWSDGSAGNTISVSTPGTYTVTVTTPAGCQYQKSVTVTQGSVPIVQNAALSQCSNSSTATFDLTSAQPGITSTPGVTFAYYTNQADAMAGNANTITNPSVYVSANAVVYVRVASAACFKVAEIQLSILTTAVPSITASSDTICFGGSITLTSNQTTGNTWSTGETTQSITVNTPGTYTLTSSVAGCQSIPASITISAESDPDIQISGNLIVCEAPTQLTASSTGNGNTYAWSDGSAGNTISVPTPGTYTVTVTTPAGCQYQKSVTVTQGPVPVIQNTALSQCSNSSTATFDLTSAQPGITSTPGVTFAYYTNQADAMAGNANTITNPSVYVSANAVVYVRVASAACFKVAEIQLSINTNPIPVITASATTICQGNSITLTSNFPTGNFWSTGETTQSITIYTAGTYTLTVNDGTCVSEPVNINITTATDPDIQITGNLTFCEGSPNILTATASGNGNTFLWSNGVTTAINTVTTSGTYTITVTTQEGCQYQKSVTVTADPQIIINIASPSPITCTQPQITLDATASVYQPGATFLWTATGGGNIISGADTLTPVVNNSGTYTLTISSATAQGCIKQSSITVTGNTNPPALSLSSTKLTICKGESVTITATGAVDFAWAGLPGTGNSQTVTPADTTTYSVTGTGANGCTTNATITIKVVPEITSALGNIEICDGDRITLDAGSGTGYTYLWSNGESTQIIHPTQTGTYTVTINNGYCSKDFTATVTAIPKPEIQEIIYNDNSLTIKAKNNGMPPLEYSIDGGITWYSSPVFNNILRNAMYSVQVRNKGLYCIASTEYFTFFINNIITPNHDGYNDVIDFSIISKYGDFKGDIYDRYGQTVFKVSPQTPVWDGVYLSRPLPTGTYWYKLSWKDRLSQKTVTASGWILLQNRN